MRYRSRRSITEVLRHVRATRVPRSWLPGSQAKVRPTTPEGTARPWSWEDRAVSPTTRRR
jgi:hypothetical protein